MESRECFLGEKYVLSFSEAVGEDRWGEWVAWSREEASPDP